MIEIGFAFENYISVRTIYGIQIHTDRETLQIQMTTDIFFNFCFSSSYIEK